MEFDSQDMWPTAGMGQPKRSDLVAEEIKRLITTKNLLPGDKLPRESELQSMFAVSKSTIREALKSLEVQGLVKVSTGPGGGGMVVEVPLDRTFQLMQNYLFFKEVRIEDIYQVRKLLEPELAASAVAHLTDAHFDALEHNIQCCDPMAEHVEDPLAQRQEEINFHDILASASPNSFLRFSCAMINQMIRQLTVFDNEMQPREQEKFGVSNTQFHKQILQAARARDADRVRALMSDHMHDCMRSVTRMHGKLQGRLILDSEMSRHTVARNARRAGRRKTAT